MSANFIGDDGVKTIADALVNNSSLAHLDMHSCGIRDRGLGSISAMLKSNKSVESLNLRANYIQDYGIQVLAERKLALHLTRPCTRNSKSMHMAAL